VFVYTDFVNTVAALLQELLYGYWWIVIISVVMSWINPDPDNPIVRVIYSLTEPVFDWVRRRLPVFFGGLDLSPLVVIIAIRFIQAYFIPTFARLATSGLN
jgi:YggT family protein